MKAEVTSREVAQIEKRGKLYPSATLPKDISRGRLGYCFDECFVRALQSNGKYQYVEGIASNPETYEWVLHAWLTDGISAFDPTWCVWNDSANAPADIPLPSAYIGIVMPIDKVMEFMRKTGYQGVIANRQLLPGLAYKLIGGTI